MIFLLTLLRGLWHGKDTIANSGSPRPSDSGFFMSDPAFLLDHGRHDNAISGGLIGPNTIPSGNTPSRLLAVVETRHSFLAVTKLTGGIIMSQVQLADPATSHRILLFPSTPGFDWKARFNRIFDHGQGFFLTLPFSYVQEKTALLRLYQAVPEVLSGHPGLVASFFEDALRACETAEEKIETEQQKTLPGDPAQIIPFNQTAVRKGACHAE
jgi:hypothetical protein